MLSSRVHERVVESETPGYEDFDADSPEVSVRICGVLSLDISSNFCCLQINNKKLVTICGMLFLSSLESRHLISTRDYVLVG